MKNDLLFSIKKHTDKLIVQTGTRPQETFEFKMKKQPQIFSFSPPIYLIEEGKCLLRVTSFEATNSVFNINNENTSFSFSIPGYWSCRGGAKSFRKVQKVFEVRSQNDIEVHIQELKKKGNHIK